LQSDFSFVVCRVFIHLAGQGLTGTLTTELLKLSNLQVLALSLNNLSGPIPSEYGGQFSTLDLYRNALTGSLPKQLFETNTLEYFSVGHNDLTGTIAVEVDRATKMTTLFVFDNTLEGPLPTGLASIPLVAFRAQGNRFTGTIPFSLVGTLSSTWSSSLSQLWLQDNLLSGNIGQGIRWFVELLDLRLSGNLIGGSIPADVYNLTKLQSLHVSDNSLTGTLSTSLAKLANLTELLLSENRFKGKIPTEIFTLSKLTQLHLGGNLLTGTISNNITQLTNVKSVEVQFSNFSGSVPSGLCELTSLQTLIADCLPYFASPNPCPCCTTCCNRDTKECEEQRLEGPFRELFATVVGEKVNEVGSPYDKAATWIISFDTALVPLTADTLLQRYLLAVVYYLTSAVNGSWRTCNPPKLFEGETAACTFDLLVENSDDDSISYVNVPGVRWLSGENECTWSGVTCNDSKGVIGIELGKLKSLQNGTAR
jgi:hypothetical protein